MTLEEKIQLFLDSKAILNTPTARIFDNLMELLESRGVQWRGGDNPMHSEGVWFDEKEKTALMINEVEDGIGLEMTYDFKEYFIVFHPNIPILTLTDEDFCKEKKE